MQPFRLALNMVRFDEANILNGVHLEKNKIILGGIVALILLRALMGIANGSLFPALSVLLSAWVPEKERGKLATFVMAGGEVCNKIIFIL